MEAISKPFDVINKSLSIYDVIISSLKSLALDEADADDEEEEDDDDDGNEKAKFSSISLIIVLFIVVLLLFD